MALNKILWKLVSNKWKNIITFSKHSETVEIFLKGCYGGLMINGIKKGWDKSMKEISIGGIIINCHSAWIDKVYGLFLTKMHSHLPASPSLAFPCAHTQLQPCNTSLLSAFGAAHPTEHQNRSFGNKRREDKNLKSSGFFLAKLVSAPWEGLVGIVMLWDIFRVLLKVSNETKQLLILLVVANSTQAACE